MHSTRHARDDRGQGSPCLRRRPRRHLHLRVHQIGVEVERPGGHADRLDEAERVAAAGHHLAGDTSRRLVQLVQGVALSNAHGQRIPCQSFCVLVAAREWVRNCFMFLCFKVMVKEGSAKKNIHIDISRFQNDRKRYADEIDVSKA